MEVVDAVKVQTYCVFSIDSIASFNTLVIEELLDFLPVFLLAYADRGRVTRVVVFRRGVRFIVRFGLRFIKN